MMDGTYSTDDEQFMQVLYIAVSDALRTYPDEWQVIQRGVHLLLNNKVTQEADGSWTVESQSQPGKRYVVNGHCQCKAAQHGNTRCAHRWAKSLVRRALSPYTVERRDTDAVDGKFAALVTSPEWRQQHENRHGVLQSLYR